MSNVGQAALIVVGTVVGYFVGYPALGFALGSLAGAALFPTQLPDGPQLADNRTTTANIGAPIPFGFGTFAVAGNVAWLGPIITVTSEEGGKGGPEQKIYNYTQSIALIFCEAVQDGDTAIAGLLRAWENGELVYDVRPQQPGDSANGILPETDDDYSNRIASSSTYAEGFTLYLGDETQEADPTIEAVEGIGNVPGWRGTAYIVFPNRLLRLNQGQRHPNFQFEVYQAGTSDCTTTSEYSNAVLHPWIDGDPPLNPANAHDYQILEVDGTLTTPPPSYNTVHYDNLGDPLAAAAGWYGTELVYLSYGLWGYTDRDDITNDVAKSGGTLVSSFPDALSVQLHYNFATPTYADKYYYPGFSTGDSGAPFGAPLSLWWQQSQLYQTMTTPDSDDTAPPLDPPFTHGSRGGGFWYEQLQDAVICVNRVPAAPLNPCADLPDAPVSGYCVDDTGLYISNTDWVLDDSQEFKVLYTGATSVNQINAPLNPCVPVSDASADNEAFWTAAYTEAVANGQMPGGLSYGTDYPKTISAAYRLDKTVCQGIGAPATIGNIIRAVCARAGIPATQVLATDMDTFQIPGYAIASLSSGAEILTPLRSVGFFDAVESGLVGIGPVLKFVGRGKDIAATLTVDDIGAYDASSSSAGDSVPPSIKTTRSLDADLPQRVRLHYSSVARDYQPDEQDSPFRPTRASVQPLDINLPLSLGDTQALQASEINWSDAWAGRTGYVTSIDSAHPELEVGDAIAIPIEGFTTRVRIVSEKNSGFVLRELTCCGDDAKSYVSIAIAPPPQYRPPALKLLAQTALDLMDLPALQDADNDAGFYVASHRTPSGNQWNGAAVYKSADSGQSWTTLFAQTSESEAGTIVNPLVVAPYYTWDNLNAIEVDVAYTGVEFESRTDEAVLAGANAAAVGDDGRWQIIQFGNAEKISATRWSLTHILWGRRGTEHNIGTSVAGDRFVLLSSGAIDRVALQQGEIGAARTYRGVSIGASFSTGVTDVFIGRGMALMPFSPVDAKATRQDDGSILITWTRRNRLGRTLMSGTDIPMSEQTLAFQVDILEFTPTSPDTVMRTLSVTTEEASYSVANQDADFGHEPVSIRVAIYQMSAVVGRGIPCKAVLEVE